VNHKELFEIVSAIQKTPPKPNKKNLQEARNLLKQQKKSFQNKSMLSSNNDVAVDLESGNNPNGDSKRVDNSSSQTRRRKPNASLSSLGASDPRDKSSDIKGGRKAKDGHHSDHDDDEDEEEDSEYDVTCETGCRQCRRCCIRNFCCCCATCSHKENIRTAAITIGMFSAVFTAFVSAVILYLIVTNVETAARANRVLIRTDYITANLSDAMPSMLQSANLTLQTISGAPTQALSVLNNTAHISQHLKVAGDIWMPLITDILHAVATITPEDMEQLKQHFDSVLHQLSGVLEQASKSNMTRTLQVTTRTLNLVLELADRWHRQGGLGIGLGLYQETLDHLAEDTNSNKPPPDGKKGLVLK
jgi:hypothetical protein